MADSDSSSSSSEPWGKLVFLTSLPDTDTTTLSYDTSKPDIELVKDKVTIGRSAENVIPIDDPHISSLHCQLLFKDDQTYIFDTSRNGTIVNRDLIEKSKDVPLRDGDIIAIGAKANPSFKAVFKDLRPKPPGSNIIPATLDDTVEDIDVPAPKVVSQKRSAEDESEGTSKKPRHGDEIEKNLICGVCMDILHECISLLPCLHNFCGACYSDWMDKANDCPSCRTPVDRVSRNHTIQNLVEAYLTEHPEKRRSQEDIDDMKARNKITADMLKLPKKHRRYDDDYSDEEYDEEEEEEPYTPPTCAQCPSADPANKPPGFTCTPSTPHVYCTCCYCLMPNHHTVPLGTTTVNPPNSLNPLNIIPAAISAFSSLLPGSAPANTAATATATAAAAANAANFPPTKCEKCSRFFCNLYWGCKCVQKACFNRFKDFKFDASALSIIIEQNTFESEILKNYLAAKGKTINDMFSESIAKLESGEFKLVPVTPPSTTTTIGFNYFGTNNQFIAKPDSALCMGCANGFLKQLAYQYREDIPNSDLPASVVRRPDCHYGQSCRTQGHNPTHAQKYNHICKQTKFS